MMEESVTSFESPASVLTRVDRLDLILGYLEELRGNRGASGRIRSPGAASTATSSTSSSGGGTGAVAASDGGNSSVSSSPIRSLLDRRRCRPITDVVVETQLKGNLIDRVDNLEIRLLKVEEELVRAKERDEEERGERKEENKKNEKKKKKKKKAAKRGLRKLVKSCVKGDLETKD